MHNDHHIDNQLISGGRRYRLPWRDTRRFRIFASIILVIGGVIAGTTVPWLYGMSETFRLEDPFGIQHIFAVIFSLPAIAGFLAGSVLITIGGSLLTGASRSEISVFADHIHLRERLGPLWKNFTCNRSDIEKMAIHYSWMTSTNNTSGETKKFCQMHAIEQRAAILPENLFYLVLATKKWS